MNWQTVFAITNAIALAGWLLLILAPRRPFTLSLVLYAGVTAAAMHRAAVPDLHAMFVALLCGVVDPVRVPGAGAASMSDYSVRSLRAMFASDGGVTVGWTHYLALDLFTGLWIARDADAKHVGRLWQAPIVLVTFMAGPLGLLIWLIARGRRGE